MSHPAPAPAQAAPDDVNPWPALFALCLGFFMILVDSTIVSVATPAIITDFGSDVNSVVWVTSAYLLAYAVPVLITGRLGDRFGPKRLYLLGLTLFTLSSLWCGLTGTIEGLIVARVFQGLGAAMITPQTMAIITRIFPSERRGRAMALWGATAGVATLVGPLVGGILVDTLGWEWIFFINIPVGLIAFVLAARLVPTLPTNTHQFDWAGVALSGVGMFLLVFGIQEGHQYDWGTITGPISVWSLIIAGLVVFVGFVLWQARNKREPLVPLPPVPRPQLLAKPIEEIAYVGQREVAVAEQGSGTSGSRLLRACHSTKPTNTTRPAMIRLQTLIGPVIVPQSYWWPSWMPNTSRNMPRPDSATLPSRTGGCWSAASAPAGRPARRRSARPGC